MTLLAAVSCGGDGPAPPADTMPCEGAVTPIPDIQGPGDRSPLIDETVVTRGIVTFIDPKGGVYIESARPSEGRSRGLFVSGDGVPATLEHGRQVEVGGRVAELGDGSDTLTALVQVDGFSVCGGGADLPETAVELPLDPAAREALEGMRLSLHQPLVVSDVYSMHRGEWTVSTGGALRIPTEDGTPGAAASELGRLNRHREMPVALPRAVFPAAPVGSAIGSLRGIFVHDGEAKRLYLEMPPSTEPVLPRRIEPPADGHIRIVSSNLLNYFNGDGRGGGFPTERGAATPDEFRAQQARTRAAFLEMQPHLVAVQELENDGFGPDSAAQSLLDLLNADGPADWAFVDPGIGPIGGDVITVGLFYRRGILEPVGSARVLRGPAFDGLSRQPLAQRFRDRASGATFWLAVNHLKSKGRCPEGGPDSDQGDGQGCWSRARVEAVHSLTPWLDGLARESGTPNVLIMGDMNAWRREEPIDAFRSAGYVELVETLSGEAQHSFLYFGQRGTLDYAFATPELRQRARQAVIWHINSDWPREMPLPQPWLRMSDHDPVVVDFDFSQSATSD